MPSWEIIGIAIGIAASLIAACAVIGFGGSWLVTELIREFREMWDKADPARKEKEGKQ